MDIELELPESLCNMYVMIIRYGVYHLLIPPSDLLHSWALQDGDLFKSNHSQEKFIQSINCEENEGNEENEENKFKYNENNIDEKDTDNIECIRPILENFGKEIELRITNMLLFEIMPLLDTEIEAKTKEKEISDLLFSLLSSIQHDVNTANGKKILRIFTSPDQKEQNTSIVQKMMIRHKYEENALMEAHKIVLKMFMNKVDEMVTDITNYMKIAVQKKLTDVFIQERRLLPGPMPLE